MVSSERKANVVLVAGLFTAILGIIFFFCFSSILNYLLKKEISLMNGTIGYKAWVDIPFPIYQKLYFFNITNGEDFMRRGAKPVLKEVGPYTFRSRWVKEAVEWHSNGTVSFKEVRTFVFLRNESIGSQDDQVVTLNAPLLMAANFIKDYEISIKLAASFLFGVAGERLIVKKSIKQLAFDGYRDIIILLSPLLKKDIPFKEGLFAWLYGRNHTDDGLFNVFTGEDGLEKLNVIDRWNGKKTLDFWNGKACNMFNGSNAELSPPIETGQQTFEFFQSIFCRSLVLSYAGDAVHTGINSKHFMATKDTLANGTVNPKNTCFDTDKKLPTGAQDISSCQYGAPVVLSFPHFYFGDPWYLKMVDGLKPNATLHGFHIDVEPNTGVSVDAAVRFQINMYLQRIRGISQLQGIPKVVFPVFWAEIDFTLTNEYATLFKNRVIYPKLIAYIVICCCIAVGCLICLGAMIRICWMQRKRSKISPEPAFIRTGRSN